MKKIIKTLVPTNTKRKLHKLFSSILWPIYLRIYIRKVEYNQPINNNLINKLIYAWENQGFSANPDYLQTCIKQAKQSEGLILECGSGLTTILVGVIAKNRQLPLISLEHKKKWFLNVRKQVERYNLAFNNLYHSPLVRYNGFKWYDVSDIKLKNISVIICDGPPGDTYGGRKGVVYILKSHLHNGTTILVDDTVRRSERNMIDIWGEMLRIDVKFMGSQKSYAVLEIKDN